MNEGISWQVRSHHPRMVHNCHLAPGYCNQNLVDGFIMQFVPVHFLCLLTHPFPLFFLPHRGFAITSRGRTTPGGPRRTSRSSTLSSSDAPEVPSLGNAVGADDLLQTPESHGASLPLFYALVLRFHFFASFKSKPQTKYTSEIAVLV